MNRKLLPLLGVAFVVAVIATGIFYGLIAGKLRNVSSATSRTPIVVATRNLEPGTVVEKADVKLHPWAGPTAPTGAYNSPDQVIGLTVLQGIAGYEPVTKMRLGSKESGGALGIPAGMRAVSIQAPESPGVVRLLRPGHKVDIQAVRSRSGPRSGEAELRTILQNVEVLAIPPDPNQSRGAPGPVLTVLVKPSEAEMLSLADAGARLRVVLRNPLDEERAALAGGELASLFQRGRPGSFADRGFRAAASPKAPALAPRPASTPGPNVPAAGTEVQLRVQIAGAGAAAVEELNTRLLIPRRSEQLQVSAFRPGWDLESAVRRFQANQWLEVFSASSLLAGHNRQVKLQAGARWSQKPAGCEIEIQFLASITAGGTMRLRVEPEITAPHGEGVATRRIETEVELSDGQSFLVSGLGDGSCPAEKLFPGRAAEAGSRELLVLVTPQLLRRVPTARRTAALLKTP